jgi:hypothetical protein
MHKFYETKMEELTQWDSTLKRNFPRTAFAAALFNLGPKTECYLHRDWANISWGQCAVTALGEYDADQGSHLVCWDLGLVIRFPPGSTIFIPSALVRHSNTPVALHECRYSFAQYMPSGLFRWVGQGFKLGPKKGLKESPVVQQQQWNEGLSRLSKLSDL